MFRAAVRVSKLGLRTWGRVKSIIATMLNSIGF